MIFMFLEWLQLHIKVFWLFLFKTYLLYILFPLDPNTISLLLLVSVVFVLFCFAFFTMYFLFWTSLLPSTLGTLPHCNSLLRFRKNHKTGPDMWNLKYIIIKLASPHILILDCLKYICISVSPTNMEEIPQNTIILLFEWFIRTEGDELKFLPLWLN